MTFFQYSKIDRKLLTFIFFITLLISAIFISSYFSNTKNIMISNIKLNSNIIKLIIIADKDLNQKSVKNEFINRVKAVEKSLVYRSLNDTKISALLNEIKNLDNRDKIKYKLAELSNRVNSYIETRVQTASTAVYILIITLIIFSLIGNFIYRLKKRSEIKLSYFKEGVDKSDNSIILTNANKEVIYVNEAFEEITGYKKEEVLGKNPRFLNANLKEPDFYTDLHKTLNRGQRWFGEFINRKKDGTIFYEKASIIPIFNGNKEAQFYMSIKLDITKDKEYQRSIEEKNREITKRYYYDNLTLLPNRNRLMEDLKKDIPYTLLLINIDAFKGINDFYGLQIGDRVIKGLAESLKSVKIDHSFTLYRLHSDEFAILIKRTLGKIETLNLIENIEKNISNYNFCTPCKQSVIFSVTVGISYGKSETLLINAAVALKHAKTNRDKFVIFSKDINVSKEYKNNILWLKKLKDAIKDDRIVPYFQPIVDGKSGKVYYYESLIRLIDTDGTVISPSLFLDISKKSKLYSSLTKIMINKSFDMFEDSSNSFSINISYEDMVNSEVVELLIDRLSRFKNPQNFIAEIVESEGIDNYEVAKDFIKHIKSFGSKIAIDDFGSGYSNFSRLFELNVDYLKIDGSIIKNIDSDEQLKIITSTIVEFAKKSNMKVVAEFVHSKEIERILKELDIKFMQGYHFSAPVKDIKYKESVR